MLAALPLTRDLVLIGGGHAHALLLRRWGMEPLPGARLTLISPEPTAPYTGMLPGHIAGHYPRDALEIDLVRLARHAGGRLILDRATGIDRAAGTVLLAAGPPVAFDVASLDVGITSAMPEVPGFADHAVPAKPLAGYATRWAGFMEDVAAGRSAPEVAVIGGGVAGVELALAMAHRLRAGGHASVVSVLEAGAEALSGSSARARRTLAAHMDRLGVSVLTRARVAEVGAGSLRLEDGRSIAAALTVGAAGARPQGWLEGTGLALTNGDVTVDRHLRSVTDPRIFAAGDCAHMAESPRPKAGVFAVRQAPFLWQNLRAALGAGRMRAYRPQRDYLKLVSTGGRGAVADKWGRSFDGGWLWRIKDGIDARFMRSLSELPPMPPPPAPPLAAEGLRAEMAEARPLCGGCGAKVGAGALRAALAGLPAVARDDLLAGPGDDAAVLRHGDGVQVISTDHLRALTDDPRLMARIAVVHALGDIWAMGAAPQVALASVILPRMAPALQTRTLAEIMGAAAEVLAGEGAEVGGGHSSLGAEMVLGFTVTGLAARPVTKAGARPGDALILTRALGSGTLMAAEMARDARGPDIAALWRQMAAPQGAAARLLAPVAHAMTDVTGFGLAGHLLELLDASAMAAVLRPAAIPLLPGAAEASGRHASTLAPANRAAVAGRVALPDDAVGRLLVDPQTAGPLLAAVPGAMAEGLVAALRDAGFAAAVIGEVQAGAPAITLA